MTADPTALLTALHWLRPQWLWALLALPLLWWWWRARQRRHSVWRDVVDPHLLAHLLDHKSGAQGRGASWLGALGFLFAVCALAGPSWHQVEQPLWQQRAPLVIALDLSSATLANDLQPSRLLQARAKVKDLLQSRAGGQVGLVAYAGDAFTVAPLTDDVANVALFVDTLAPDIMPVDGSRSDRAIDGSVRLLRQAGFDRGDILLLTDHADVAARTAAAEAARAGYRVSVLGLGTTAGAAYRNAEGRIARTALDAASLRALATAGGGGYSALTADHADLVVLGVLDPRKAGTMSARGTTSSVWRDEGYWLLLPLMLLALLAFRRGGALAAVLLCTLLPWQPARAVDELWQRPDQQSHAQAQDAVQAYRDKDYTRATQVWRGVPGADADYNRGNALARTGSYEEAIAAYDEALKAKPGMADAIANRKAVLAAMKRKPPQGPGQGNQGDKDQDKQAEGKQGQDKENQGSPQDSGDRNGQNPSQQSAKPRDAAKPSQDPSLQTGQQPQPSQPGRTGRDGQSGKPPGQPVDPVAQNAADAAQRARMQRALSQAQSDKVGKDGKVGKATASQPATRNETPEEREQRLANEAWLKRVPDDPGGLLRAKFRLEHERRLQSGDE